MRVTAAVYEALGSIMNEMSQRFGNTLDSIRDNLIQNLTEQIINNAINTCGVIGWRQAVYLDMTDPNTNCPTGWNMTRYSKRTCGRASTEGRSCDSVFFLVSGGPYSQVCGRIRAYQWGIPDGFIGYRRELTTINSGYFDGVAVMHGSPRQHIWTFAVGWSENAGTYGGLCPCDTSADIPIPPLERTIFVSLGVYVIPLDPHTYYTLMTFSGMGETATPPVHVVLSTILHISPKHLARQLLMTLN